MLLQEPRTLWAQLEKHLFFLVCIGNLSLFSGVLTEYHSWNSSKRKEIYLVLGSGGPRA